MSAIAWRPRVRDGHINWSSINEDIVEPSVVTTVVLSSAEPNLAISRTVDLQATVTDQYGSPMAGLSGVTFAVPGSVVTASQIGATNDLGKAVIRVTGNGAGTASVSVQFNGVTSNAVSITVFVPVVAELAGAASLQLIATANITTGKVKGILLPLVSKLGVPRASVTGVEVSWWDGERSGAPAFTIDSAEIDESGILRLNLDAVTQLDLGETGHLDLFKRGADFRTDWNFSSRIAIMDIGQ